MTNRKHGWGGVREGKELEGSKIVLRRFMEKMMCLWLEIGSQRKSWAGREKRCV